MRNFDPLTWAFEDWFDSPFEDLPARLRARANRDFLPMSWKGLTGDQRRAVALQLDYQRDPSTKRDQQFWLDFYFRKGNLQSLIAEWTAISTATATELAKKEERLTALQRELARMEHLSKKQLGGYYPAKTLDPNSTESTSRYIAYPLAIRRLAEAHGATPEELAAWVWFGPDGGGLAAYLNANELEPPPRFFFWTGGDPDYVAALMACWFDEREIADFVPTERFITGDALIKRWSEHPALRPEAFIKAKIEESRISDLHPIFGGTQVSSDVEDDWPPLSTGLFAKSEIERIESEELGIPGEPSTVRKRKAKALTHPNSIDLIAVGDLNQTAVANVSVKIAAGKLKTQELRKKWQIAYRKSKRLHPDKKDTWHARQIAKTTIAEGRGFDSIRKFMK